MNSDPQLDAKLAKAIDIIQRYCNTLIQLN